uniref:AGPT-Pplase3 domain-containing protein n=1 Tax=Steinernema glaseri TaxID=37863 RepID=A0A1I7YUW5_9BILA
MNSLFKTAAKQIIAENLSPKSLPKAALIEFQKCTSILQFQKAYRALPSIPDECFVFTRDFAVDGSRTFKKAEKYLDLVDIFAYFLELGHVHGLRSIWKRLDDKQKPRIYDLPGKLPGFFADFFESRRGSGDVFSLYAEARTKNFELCRFFFERSAPRLRATLLLDELATTLRAPRSSWRSSCRHLATLVSLQDAEVELSEIRSPTITRLEESIRENRARYRSLPEDCRIPAVEEFVASNRILSHPHSRLCVNIPVF